MEAINNFLTSTGFFQFTQGDNWKCLIMIFISCVLLFLGIKKKFEPLLLVPIAIGMLVTNLPGLRYVPRDPLCRRSCPLGYFPR